MACELWHFVETEKDQIRQSATEEELQADGLGEFNDRGDSAVGVDQQSLDPRAPRAPDLDAVTLAGAKNPYFVKYYQVMETFGKATKTCHVCGQQCDAWCHNTRSGCSSECYGACILGKDHSGHHLCEEHDEKDVPPTQLVEQTKEKATKDKDQKMSEAKQAQEEGIRSELVLVLALLLVLVLVSLEYTEWECSSCAGIDAEHLHARCGLPCEWAWWTGRHPRWCGRRCNRPDEHDGPCDCGFHLDWQGQLRQLAATPTPLPKAAAWDRSRTTEQPDCIIVEESDRKKRKRGGKNHRAKEEDPAVDRAPTDGEKSDDGR